MRFVDGHRFRLDAGDLLLEPLALRHAPGVVEAGGDPIFDWLPTEPFTSVEQAAAWIVEARQHLDAGTQIPLAITREGRFLGSTRLMHIHTGDDDLEIGWTWLGRASQRTSVNTTCKRALLAYGFETLGVPRVVFKTDLRNAPSQAAIERIGATGRRVVLDEHLNGRVRDSVYYTVERARWPEVRAHLDRLSRR